MVNAVIFFFIFQHYIDLNDPYLMMNTQRLGDGQSDYLSMLSPPTFEALSSPHYVNEMVGQEPLEDSGYLSMKPNTIFSPRAEEGWYLKWIIYTGCPVKNLGQNK